ncbi:MAG: sulfite exporter TauE/SafE family protein [Cytophagaceae bacterium]
MLSALVAGLLISLAGSLHCIGMCGPIALAIPIQQSTGALKLLKILTYNFGRVCSYVLIGVIFGLIGKGFSLGGILQYFSVAAGILLIYFSLTKNISAFKFPVFSQFINLNSFISKLMGRKDFRGLFLLGIGNGLLPCGMVFIACAAAVSTGSVVNGSILMAGFGLGTIPVMTAISFSGSLISLDLRKKINKAMPVIACMIGLLLIVRGLNLGVPYLSPKIQRGTIYKCH